MIVVQQSVFQIQQQLFYQHILREIDCHRVIHKETIVQAVMVVLIPLHRNQFSKCKKHFILKKSVDDKLINSRNSFRWIARQVQRGKLNYFYRLPMRYSALGISVWYEIWIDWKLRSLLKFLVRNEIIYNRRVGYIYLMRE